MVCEKYRDKSKEVKKIELELIAHNKKMNVFGVAHQEKRQRHLRKGIYTDYIKQIREESECLAKPNETETQMWTRIMDRAALAQTKIKHFTYLSHL